jgi:hypothetical protein
LESLRFSPLSIQERWSRCRFSITVFIDSSGEPASPEYIQANNRAALVPAILPALLLLLVSLILLFARPAFMSPVEAGIAFGLNLAQLASTMIWQRKLQAEMAETGYDDAKIQRLLTTNWIRTVAFLIEALLATVILLRALGQIR